MVSEQSPMQTDPRREGDVVPLAPKNRTGAEDSLSGLASDAARDASVQRSRTAGLDFSAGPRMPKPPLGESLGDQLSLGRRVSRSLARFLMTACIGVAATLAWQAYGSESKRMIAGWAPQLGWLLSLPSMNPPPSPEIGIEQPSPTAIQASVPGPAPAQAAAVAPTAPESASPTAPAGPSPELQQLEMMAHDLIAVRQSVEQVAARQEQMARDIAKLQTTEQEIRHRISAAPPRPTAAPARQPVPLPLQPVPQSSAPPPLPMPESPSRPPMPVR
jgi:hypothetical protein